MHAASGFALNTAAPPFQVISTASVNAASRREFWESGGTFLFGALQLEQRGREPFDASFSYAHLGDLIFCRLAARVPHRAVRTKTVASNDDRPFLKAVLQTQGHSMIAQDGCSIALGPGDWTVYDAGHPYSVELSAGGEFSMILAPREKIAARGCIAQGVALRPFSARCGLGKLVWNLLDGAIGQVPELPDRSAFDVAEIVAQLFRVALFDSFESRASVNSGSALRERVKLYISAHLRDADLSIDKLAAATRCSKRYLHMIFRPEEVSISDYILKARLERCRAELLSHACAHRSITEIAYSWGFNNSNHFSRSFRREFGIAPRDLRRNPSQRTKPLPRAVPSRSA